MENTFAGDGLQTAVKVEHCPGEHGQAAASWWLVSRFFRGSLRAVAEVR
jgi:hypothetical protein